MQLLECLFVVAVVILTIADCGAGVETLSPDMEGVCSVKIRTPHTRTKFYTVASNKWCGKKKCIVKKSKVEKYIATTSRLACCNGWEYNEDKCVPLCRMGCSGGRCVAPDICTCDPPAYMSPDTNNTCVTAKCDLVCVNGVCQNNTCECHDGFVRLNSTACQAKCEEGYKNDPADLSCKSHCDGCTHGNCTEPYTCICSEGYAADANGTCLPVCDACENGSCVGVNKCVCNEGYAFDSEGKACMPVCEGCDGDCSAPGICECHEGYELQTDGTCQPDCGPCVNGSCSASGTCVCGQGMVMVDGACVDGCGGRCAGTCAGDECTEEGQCRRMSSET